jgi:hypothetical protein
MTDSGQATVEYAGLMLLLVALLLGATVAARAALAEHPRGDAAALALAARHVPRFIAERGDGEHPVDFRRCRQPACARSGRPVLYVHAVRAHGFTYLEYWEYLPDSRTAHTGIAAFDGYHHDDWEGVILTRYSMRVRRCLVPYRCPQRRNPRPTRPRTRSEPRPARGIRRRTGRDSGQARRTHRSPAC